jgi:hypothetical protein
MSPPREKPDRPPVDIAQRTLALVQEIHKALPARPAPVIYIARVRRRGVQLASWPVGKAKVRWTSKRREATSFQLEDSASSAMGALRARRGETIELWRILT